MSELNGIAPGAAPQPKILICTVDDAWFGIRTDWVNAVCPESSTSSQTIRIPNGKPQRVLLFQGEPALVVEMRSVVGLAGDEEPARDQFALVRSGSCVAALPIDRCIGIRSLDLESRAPVPSRIRRDDGMPIGHLVELDGRMLVVLDPQRLLDSRTRSLWPSAVRRAEALKKRQAKMDSLWSEIRVDPSAASVRSFATLCSRAGRARTATAARALLGYLPNGDPLTASNQPAGDGVIRSLLQAAEEKRTGRLIVEGNGSGDAALDLVQGRVVEVRRANRSGSTALSDLLSSPYGGSRFLDQQPQAALGERRGTSAVAVLIEALEAAVPEKRRRRGGAA